ncbi:MAG: sugar phosphate isomerase/epimerase [Candidatus Bipolaricaulota bacterium]|nr:sugar phosphate isomerase/epimerase [Candidatus Bipolaricaulota bacterium]
MMTRVLASSLAFHPERPDRVVDRAFELGFAGVEFLCEPPWHPAAWSGELVRRVRATGGGFSLHAPVADVNLMSPHPAVRAVAEEEILATVRLAAGIGAGEVTFHIGYRPLAGIGADPPWGAARAALRRLHRAAEGLGVALCLENDPRLPGAYLWDLTKFREILGEVGLAGTLDLGHAWISHRAEAFAHLPALLPHLRVVHLHDNHGRDDEHLALGAGAIPWDRVWGAWGEVPLKVIEVHDPAAAERSRRWIAAREG